MPAVPLKLGFVNSSGVRRDQVWFHEIMIRLGKMRSGHEERSSDKDMKRGSIKR